MDHLPMDSALRRSIHGDDFVEWTQVVSILKEILFTLQWSNYQRGEGKGTEPRMPDAPVAWDLDPLPSVEEE